MTTLHANTYAPHGHATAPPTGLSCATFPAELLHDDCRALAAQGFHAWWFPRPIIVECCKVGGWAAHVEAAGYDPRHGVERWYSDGSLVVYTHVRLPVAKPCDCEATS